MPSTTQLEPHSTDAERSVLGCLLLDSDAIHKVIAKLQPSDFFDPIYRAVYTAVCELCADAQAIDVVTVADKLRSDPRLQQLGGMAFLAELPVEVPTSMHVEQYAEILTNQSTRRQLLKLGKNVAALAEDDTRSTTDLIESVEQQLLQLQYTATQDKPQSLGDMCLDRYEHYTTVHEAEDPSEYYGIQTGFTELDKMVVGLQPGDVMVVGGRPSMGKTAIALEMARHMASEQNKKVTIFSLEMNKEQLFDRLFAAFHQVEEHKLSRGDLRDEQLESMGTTFDALGSIPLYLDDDADKTITNLRSKARRHKMEHGIDVLIIDYLQLIQVPTHLVSANRTEHLRYISENIKALAREIDAPIIALSQLNREADRRTDKRPQLSDLRESGAIEQDADYALLLYRDSYYDEDCDDPFITDLYLKKNRPHGETGHVELRFNKEQHRFESIETPHLTTRPHQ
ncbi:replicative DNA helicase [bacterium]|nr:replicative DNA helicase [bacterium]